MICISCGKEHDGTFGSGKYCCRSCSNKRQWSEETKIKRGNSIKKWWSFREENEINESSKKIQETRLETIKRFILESDWKELRKFQKRKRVLYDQNFKCNKCGLQNWNNTQIKLQYHHKDGNRRNEERENVEYLCPNCHSQTDHFCVNKKHSRL
jgi:hypothetical protein